MTTPFRKGDMLDELRTILLFEGDHLILGRGLKFAESFLGFVPDDGDNYCLDAPAKVDLAPFPIAGSFDRGYDYAFAPTNPIQIDESEVQDLIVFMDGVPRIGGTSMAGILHDFMTPKGMCRRVADTVFARWKLEIEHVDEFTIRELGLLANMTEGAVRNAISVGDLRTIKRGTSTWVQHADALAWLRGRKGFVAMPAGPDEDDDVSAALRSATTRDEFAGALHSAMATKNISEDDLASAIGLSEADCRRWLSGEVVRDFRAAADIAKLLEISEADVVDALRRAAMGNTRIAVS